MEVIVYMPDLTNIRAWFEVPKRYYQRNKEMVEACGLLHAFISKEDGFIGGTRFEIEYAVSDKPLETFQRRFSIGRINFQFSHIIYRLYLPANTV